MRGNELDRGTGVKIKPAKTERNASEEPSGCLVTSI